MLVLSGFWASSQTASCLFPRRQETSAVSEMTNDLNTHERTIEIQTLTLTPRNINMNHNEPIDKEKQQRPLKLENTLKSCEVTAQNR